RSSTGCARLSWRSAGRTEARTAPPMTADGLDALASAVQELTAAVLRHVELGGVLVEAVNELRAPLAAAGRRCGENVGRSGPAGPGEGQGRGVGGNGAPGGRCQSEQGGPWRGHGLARVGLLRLPRPGPDRNPARGPARGWPRLAPPARRPAPRGGRAAADGGG